MKPLLKNHLTAIMKHYVSLLLLFSSISQAEQLDEYIGTGLSLTSINNNVISSVHLGYQHQTSNHFMVKYDLDKNKEYFEVSNSGYYVIEPDDSFSLFFGGGLGISNIESRLFASFGFSTRVTKEIKFGVQNSYYDDRSLSTMFVLSFKPSMFTNRKPEQTFELSENGKNIDNVVNNVPVPSNKKTCFYKVKNGQRIWSIARELKMSPFAIIEANQDIKKVDLIYVDQLIKLPYCN
ncbi:LysM peptidoglycan-binding domain-containing protein [Vibrio owensii]|uniref:LysM peptidoglycan-binding domain-containing protein n=1 Tax=Vibrio owensii TaxID=696485 RepID=UPI0040698615